MQLRDIIFAAVLSLVLHISAWAECKPTRFRCAIGDESDVLQVKGKVLAENLLPLPPEADTPVDVYLHLTTHFGQQKVFLRKEPPEQDAQGLKTRLASSSIESQVQRAVMWAASCLASGDLAIKKAGLEILDVIHTLER